MRSDVNTGDRPEEARRASSSSAVRVASLRYTAIIVRRGEGALSFLYIVRTRRAERNSGCHKPSRPVLKRLGGTTQYSFWHPAFRTQTLTLTVVRE